MDFRPTSSDLVALVSQVPHHLALSDFCLNLSVPLLLFALGFIARLPPFGDIAALDRVLVISNPYLTTCKLMNDIIGPKIIRLNEH